MSDSFLSSHFPVHLASNATDAQIGCRKFLGAGIWWRVVSQSFNVKFEQIHWEIRMRGRRVFLFWQWSDDIINVAPLVSVGFSTRIHVFRADWTRGTAGDVSCFVESSTWWHCWGALSKSWATFLQGAWIFQDHFDIRAVAKWRTSHLHYYKVLLKLYCWQDRWKGMLMLHHAFLYIGITIKVQVDAKTKCFGQARRQASKKRSRIETTIYSRSKRW